MKRTWVAAFMCIASWFAMPAAGTNGPNHTALWWNPQESGWGVNLNQQGDIIFATLFTYADDSAPLWLVADELLLQGDGSYRGKLYRTAEPNNFGAPLGSSGYFPGATLSVLEVGTMSVSFASTTSATLTYAYNGVTVTKQIQPQVFASPVPVCSSTTESRVAATNYQDLWWNPLESGWGINLAQQGDVVFATLFTYAASGRNQWLVASGLRRQDDGTFFGPLYATTGPAFDSAPWGSIGVSEIGAMTLRFYDGQSGLLTYTVQGVTTNKSIVRQVFGGSLPLCQ